MTTLLSLWRSTSPARKLWLGAGLALGLTLAFLMWPRGAEVEASRIDRGAVLRDIVDEGRTRFHDVYTISAPVTGELQRITLEPGDRVRRGDVVGLVRPAPSTPLDPRSAAEARAAIAAADAQVALAERDQARTAQLAARGFASPAALDQARATLQAARAQLAQARAASGAGGVQGRAIPLRSPADGSVLRVLQESQTVIAAGGPVMEIGDPGRLEVVAEFLSQDAVLIRPGARASLEGWGGNGPLAARVERVEPNARTELSALGVEEQRTNVILRLTGPAAPPALGHGFRVDARIIIAEHAHALRAPTDALLRQGEGWAVYRVIGGRARLTPVRIGDGNERFRVVLSGLAEGDTVVRFPAETLHDGALVRATLR